MICNFCKSDKHKIIYNYTRLEKNKILQCDNCSLVFLDINKTKENIEDYYRSKYRVNDRHLLLNPNELFFSNITRNDASNYTNFISKHIAIEGKSVLDIGSASGRLLIELMKSGAKEAAGIELDQDFTEYARKKGLNIFNSPIESLKLKNSYNIIVSFHTLEHMFDPLNAIEAIYSSLTPGGYFLGEVPNQNDWRIKIFNNELIKRFHYDPDHYYYFSAFTLRKYLRKAGFTKIKFETVERYNSCRQLRDILCLKDLNENKIREILKRHIFMKNKEDDTRLLDQNNLVEIEFNKVFEKALNLELIGNCLRWTAYKN